MERYSNSGRITYDQYIERITRESIMLESGVPPDEIADYIRSRPDIYGVEDAEAAQERLIFHSKA